MSLGRGRLSTSLFIDRLQRLRENVKQILAIPELDGKEKTIPSLTLVLRAPLERAAEDADLLPQVARMHGIR